MPHDISPEVLGLVGLSSEKCRDAYWKTRDNSIKAARPRLPTAIDSNISIFSPVREESKFDIVTTLERKCGLAAFIVVLRLSPTP
jgi:hypothetical protein